MTEKWTFVESLGNGRLDALADAPPFDEIARSIASVMRVQCTHVDQCDEAYGFRRFVGCVSIDRPLFDVFFNSFNGYRGCYYRSPSEGLRINAQFVGRLAPSLIEFQQHEDMSAELALISLIAPSAKCWLAETGKGFCPKCEGDWTKPKDDSPEILNGRWDIAETPYSRFGRKAPYLEKLRVIGGFVSQTREHYIAQRKINRAQDIHDVGWS